MLPALGLRRYKQVHGELESTARIDFKNRDTQYIAQIKLKKKTIKKQQAGVVSRAEMANSQDSNWFKGRQQIRKTL